MTSRVEAASRAFQHALPYLTYDAAAKEALAAADAVMFSEEALRRAYEALKRAVDFTPYNTMDPEVPDEDPYANGLIAVIAALNGAGE